MVIWVTSPSPFLDDVIYERPLMEMTKMGTFEDCAVGRGPSAHPPGATSPPKSTHPLLVHSLTLDGASMEFEMTMSIECKVRLGLLKGRL